MERGFRRTGQGGESAYSYWDRSAVRISAADRIEEEERNDWGILKVVGLAPVAVMALSAFAAAPACAA